MCCTKAKSALLDGASLPYWLKRSSVINNGLALHFAELLIIGYRTGRGFGVSVMRSIVMCLLFGYIWWLPIRKSMKADDLSDSDFIEDGAEPWRERANV